MFLASASLKMNSHDFKLRRMSLLPDFFTDFAGVRGVDTPNTLPSGIVITYVEKGGNTTHTIPLLKELEGVGGMGRQRAKGTEEDQVVASLKVYANAWFTTVSTAHYGVDYTESKYLKLLEAVTPQLGLWTQQRKGRYIRQALCQRYSEPLTMAPTSLTQSLNPNFNFVGANLISPAYDPNTATFTTNIIASRPLTPDANNRLTIKTLNNIIRYATESKILQPLEVSGKARYILTMSGRQKANLMDPTSTTGLFTLFKEADIRGANKALKYEMYEYGDLLLVVDPRCPVCTVTGSTITFAYKDVGRADARDNTADNTRFDVCMLLGNQAVYEYVTEPQHFRSEKDDYDRVGGVGTFQVSGFVMTSYDEEEAKTANSIVQQYSALFLAGTN